MAFCWHLLIVLKEEIFQSNTIISVTTVFRYFYLQALFPTHGCNWLSSATGGYLQVLPSILNYHCLPIDTNYYTGYPLLLLSIPSVTPVISPQLLLATLSYSVYPQLLSSTLSYCWLPSVTSGCPQLLPSTLSYCWLPSVTLSTLSYSHLPPATTGYPQLPLATLSYRWLPSVNLSTLTYSVCPQLQPSLPSYCHLPSVTAIYPQLLLANLSFYSPTLPQAVGSPLVCVYIHHH